jgi:probable H4MPT-linked C1 transfer pathway protein
LSFEFVIGWDIGGVNTKAARVANGAVLAVRSRPYELQRDPRALVPLLRELADEVGRRSGDAHAVTMTAELSQMFRTKREGVAFVLDAVAAAFGASCVHVFTVDGRFLDVASARAEPLLVAAANWAATARQIAVVHPDAILVDIGTTSTDIIPIVAGQVRAAGLSDPARLSSGELVYTGAVRTPVEAIASHVPVGGRPTGVSAEGFAIAGDVHVWRGHLAPHEYSSATPDGRPVTREFVAERLARVVCADRELLDEAGITEIADAIAHAQIARVAEAITMVRDRHPSVRTAVVTGLGVFIAAVAARAAGLEVLDLAESLGPDAARCAPAASVALLLEHALGGSQDPPLRRSPEIDVEAGLKTRRSRRDNQPVVEMVVKLGGGVLADSAAFASVLNAIGDVARSRRLLIVPGGGPFADAVREVDRREPLSDDAAHWMAILAMDQYAELIASRLGGSALVWSPDEIRDAIDAGTIPVVAPSRWLRDADPLPHTWEVTSDSIAAWVAGALGATQLVLVKPPGARGDAMVDPYFERALGANVTPVIVSADRVPLLWPEAWAVGPGA